MTRIEGFNATIRGAVTLAFTAAFLVIVLYRPEIKVEVFTAFMATYNTVLVHWFVSRDQKAAATNGNGHQEGPKS